MMSEISEANIQGGRVWCLQSICSVAGLHRFIAILVFLSEVANVCYGLCKRVAWALNRAQTAANLGGHQLGRTPAQMPKSKNRWFSTQARGAERSMNSQAHACNAWLICFAQGRSRL